MKRRKRTTTPKAPASSDAFLGEYDNVKPGDKIAIHYGVYAGAPRVGRAYGKYSNRFGRWIRVKFDDYTFETVHSFRTVGIGAYLLKRQGEAKNETTRSL